jgi:hypothetical protein
MNFHSIKEYIKGLTLGASLITSLSLSESQAHTFQTNLYPDIELKEDKLVIELWIASFLFPPLQHINYGDGKERPNEKSDPMKIESFFNDTCPVSINGINQMPQLEWLKFEEMEEVSHLGQTTDLTMAKLKFNYPIKEDVRNIKFGWGLWFPDEPVTVKDPESLETVSHDPNVLDMLIFVEGDAQPLYISKAEPEFIWHAEPKVFSESPVNTINAAKDTRTTQIPLASILILFVGLLLFIKAARSNVAVKISVAAAACICSLIFKDSLMIEFNPSDGSRAPELNNEKAKDTFTKLHRGIYRAFESETEDAIYNNLAKSVTHNLVGPLYEDIYQSLIMRDEGGAVSRVNRIEYLDIQTGQDEKHEKHQVSCNWQVHGTVRHWGHNHFRSNEYEADYELAVENGLWKISSSTVNMQKRVRSKKSNEGTPNSDQKS